jgi:hypothetical protein
MCPKGDSKSDDAGFDPISPALESVKRFDEAWDTFWKERDENAEYDPLAKIYERAGDAERYREMLSDKWSLEGLARRDDGVTVAVIKERHKKSGNISYYAYDADELMARVENREPEELKSLYDHRPVNEERNIWVKALQTLGDYTGFSLGLPNIKMEVRNGRTTVRVDPNDETFNSAEHNFAVSAARIRRTNPSGSGPGS